MAMLRKTINADIMNNEKKKKKTLRDEIKQNMTEEEKGQQQQQQRLTQINLTIIIIFLYYSSQSYYLQHYHRFLKLRRISGACLIERTARLPQFIELGPPDYVTFINIPSMLNVKMKLVHFIFHWC